jgi:recombinational DNA repair ATPase RecF
VRIESLELANLRSHQELSLRFDAPLVILDGDNGAGKTTVLEAISLICALKSFRDAKRKDLIRSDGPGHARVRCKVDSNGLRRELVLQLSQKGRVLRVDGKRPESLASWFRDLKCVSFVPPREHTHKSAGKGCGWLPKSLRTNKWKSATFNTTIHCHQGNGCLLTYAWAGGMPHTR